MQSLALIRDAHLAVLAIAGLLAGPVLAAAPAKNQLTVSPTAVNKSIHEFDDCQGAAWCPRMVVIPAGTFSMGAPPDEKGGFMAEGPVRRVSVHAFAAGKFDVTRGQWAAFASATNREPRRNCTWTGRTGMEPDPEGSWRNLGFAQDDTHPVVCVSWTDAQDYVLWLSKRTGHAYRLLSEAEWEYAARAGTKTAYPWGEQASHDHANYGRDECCGPMVSGRDRWEHTSPVGSFPANAFGLYDMHGDVLQWVQDCLSLSYSGLPLDGSAYEQSVTLEATGDMADMSGTRSCEFRILRGGDWGDPPSMIRSAFRNFGPAPGSTLQDYISGGVGFRVARSTP